MARSLNSCNFIGNLGKDVEIRATQSGKSVANFSIAVSDGYKDKQTGEQVDQTEWVRCVAFDKLADICGQYLQKGSKVFVSGRMKTRKWNDSTGRDCYTTEVAIENMQMLDGRADSKPQGSGDYGAVTPIQQSLQPDFDDSDIPF